MLPEFFKLHIVNKIGAQIDFSTDGSNNSFVITALGWKYDSNGAIEYASSEQTIFADPSADLADDASAEGAEYDNSSNKYLGLLCRASFETDVNDAGTVEIRWEWSTDGSASGTYPSDENDFDAEKDLAFVDVVHVAATTDEHRGKSFTLGASPF